MMRNLLNNYILFLFLSALMLPCAAQSGPLIKDLQSINSRLSRPHDDPYKRPYIYSGEPFSLKKINPAGVLFGSLLYVYQNVLSRHISADCLYSPSCSEFSKIAVREDGIIKGLFLTIDRINRCNIIAAQDLKTSNRDPETQRYPDPVSRYHKPSDENEDQD